MTSTYPATCTVDFAYNQVNYPSYTYQQEQEEACYSQYDLQVANAVAEADYQDYYCDYQYQDDQDEYMEEYEEEYEEEQEPYQQQQQQQQQPQYDYRNDSLLSLVVGVQNYLIEQADNSAKCDSPLYSLQYKMYTYMRQRAIELGVQL